MKTRLNKFSSLFLLLAGTLLVGFSAGRWLAPLAAWIGPVLIMRYARDHKVGKGYLFILVAYILAWLIGFVPVWVGGGYPIVLIVCLPIFYGLLWSLPYLADRLAGAQLKGFSSTLVYPLAATTVEFVNIHTNPVGSWGSTGFTQYGNLALMQLASVTGMIGITFLMGWFASVANWAWENRSRSGEMVRGLTLYGVVFTSVLAFGFLRLNLTPLSETVRVAGITARSQDSFTEQLRAANIDMDAPDLAFIHKVSESHWNAYFAETVLEAQAGAKIIIWPEASGLAYSPDEAAFTSQAQEVARQNGIYLVLPLAIIPADPDSGQLIKVNLLIIDPTGKIVLEHIKYGGSIFEGYRVQGDGKLSAVNTPFGVLSGAICWDMDYPLNIRQAGQKGVSLLLVPSRDWQEIDPLHGEMAVFRAIENGMSLMRQTDDGLSIAVDPYGRVLAQTSFYNSTDRTMVAQVPVGHVATVYTMFGRWFEWVCLAGFLFMIGNAVVRASIERRRE